jgi:hypothetical protein
VVEKGGEQTIASSSPLVSCCLSQEEHALGFHKPSIHLPESLLQKLKRAADLTHRSVEDIAITSLEAVLPPVSNVPPDRANDLTAMHLLSDKALWAATAPSFSPTEERRLIQLNAAAGERELTPAEEAEQHSLIAAYRWSVLRRAKALAILAQRGHRLPITVEANSLDDDGN